MTAAESKALVILARGPQTCASLGEQMWGSRFRQPQAYCRPAGKLLRGLLKGGYVHMRAAPDQPVRWSAAGEHRSIVP